MSGTLKLRGNLTPLVLRAKFVAPMASPVIEDGAVSIDGDRVVGVGRFRAADHAAADVEDLGDVVLMPGLVNAHTHLELSHVVRDPTPPASFGAWALAMVRSLAAPPTDAAIAAATRDGAAECLRFGVTSVGDVTRSPGVTRAALRDGPLGVVSFGEVRAMGTRRWNLDAMIDAAIDESMATDRLSVGVSPHAPYSVEPDGYRACVRALGRVRLPPNRGRDDARGSAGASPSRVGLTTHLAESPEEATFVHDHAGPLRALWDALGAWDEHVPRFAGSPVEFAKAVELLGERSCVRSMGVPPMPARREAGAGRPCYDDQSVTARALLAHVNYASDTDLDLLAAGSAGVVWCPRTHAWFGHAPHRWREMLARGINVCVGTDSRATSPDLNVVDDLRLIRRQAPDVDPAALWAMVTTRAARALGVADVGAIAAGMRADLVAFPVSTGDPLAEVLDGPIMPGGVWVGGKRAGDGATA